MGKPDHSTVVAAIGHGVAISLLMSRIMVDILSTLYGVLRFNVLI